MRGAARGSQRFPGTRSESDKRGAARDPKFVTSPLPMTLRGRRLQEQMTEHLIRAIVLVACLLPAGCGLVAAPCRVTSAVLDIVPLVGHVASIPTYACAEAIDPK